MNRVVDYSEFLKRYYYDNILELGKDYLTHKTLTIDYKDLVKFDMEAGDRLIDHPDQEIAQIRTALRSYLIPSSDMENLPDGVMTDAEIAISGLPDSEKKYIHKIGKDQANKLIAVEGRITKTAPIQQKLIEGAFKCQRCDTLSFVTQPDGDKFIDPFECQNDVCRRKGYFELIPEESKYEDQQKIALQDLYESVKPGQPLREIIVLVRGVELIENVPGMGTQCIITGIVRLQQKKDTSIFTSFIEALHIEPSEAEKDISVSNTEKEEFKKLAASSDIFQNLISSTAPEILGYPEIKLALLCSTVSGADDPKFREYIHVMLCGDPGTGKSALSRSIRELVSRAQYSAGKGSSVAGLTVAVIRDELSGNGYTAQAGALVLADKELMVIDEADKLESEDLQALNTALEESFIEVHKGGINQRFNTRCSVIALCNPKHIRFDDHEVISKQISIPGDTLSRFDLVFKILDQPDVEKDAAIAEHQARQWARYETGSQDEQIDGGLSQEKLSKYLQYAKTIKPRTNPETRQAIKDYYISLRKTDASGTIATTARQNNGLYRLTKAIAKLRLSNECTIADVKLAISIHKKSLEALTDPRTGKIDVDTIYGTSKSQQERFKTIMAIIQECSNGNGAHFNEIAIRGSTSAAASWGHVSKSITFG